MTQLFDDDRIEEIAEFIADELGRLLAADSLMIRRIQERYGKVTTTERALATLWALNTTQGSAMADLMTLDIEEHGFQETEPA